MPNNGVVTPEAVVLQFDTAGVGSRIAAEGIDIAIRLIGYFLFGMGIYLFGDSGGNSWIIVTIALFGIFFVTFGYAIVFETLWNGLTPGKAALGVRVVTLEGGPISFRHALIRGALATIEIWATSGVIATLAIFFSSKNQRLGDMVAGSLVLRERKAVKTPAAVAFTPYPGTEDYAATLDVTLLSQDEYLAVRSFLIRANDLEAFARHQLSDTLGSQIMARLRTHPPTGMPSEVFLVCVAAAYQRRFATS